MMDGGGKISHYQALWEPAVDPKDGLCLGICKKVDNSFGGGEPIHLTSIMHGQLEHGDIRGPVDLSATGSHVGTIADPKSVVLDRIHAWV
jgi:hypothetical protein